VQEVADRAGLSITSVYARFTGKDALVLALHERVIGDGVALMDTLLGEATVSAAPVDEVVAGIVDAAVTFAQDHAHVFRAVLLAGDGETNERAAAFIRAGSERIAGVLAPRLPVPRARAACDIDFAWRSVVAVLQQEWALGGADPGRFRLSRAQLTARLVRQFLAAIGQPGRL